MALAFLPFLIFADLLSPPPHKHKHIRFSHYHFSLFAIFHRATTASSLCTLCTAICCPMNGKIIHSHLDRPICVSALRAWKFKWHFVLISKSLAWLWMVEFLACALRCLVPSESESSKVKVKWTGKCSPADGQRWKYRRNRSWTLLIRMRFGGRRHSQCPNCHLSIQWGIGNIIFDVFVAELVMGGGDDMYKLVKRRHFSKMSNNNWCNSSDLSN